MSVAKTECGALRGVAEDGVEIYRGIPYAAAPVGSRRLAPPAPAEAWRGTRDATRFGAAPPQRHDPLVDALGLLHGCGMDEDCLQLNVFTPAADGAARPVLVWIPGGAFIGGAACVPVYDGRRLAAEDDVVVVTVSYRVGALGFSALPARAGRPAVANLGLLDQIAALRWVRGNIAGFGGDPSRVTVFGESAGAGSILALAGMPAAEGLFGRAIVQSAAPRGCLRPDEADARTAAVQAALAPGDLADAPVARVLEAQYACADAGIPRTGMYYAPVVDGRTLVTPPWESFTTGWARDVDLLIGTTRDEMWLYTTGQPATDEVVSLIVAAQLEGSDDRDARARELIAGYRAARVARGAAATPCDVMHAIQTDLSLRYDATCIAAARAERANTWMYLFTWTSPWRGGAVGACHALDLPFTFGTLDAPGMPAFAGDGDAARALSRRLRGAWTGFARGGEPGHPELGAWPAYEPGRRATMELGPRCGALDAPLEVERALLERFLGRSPLG
jgi:para-nitrobenzyl esterase